MRFLKVLMVITIFILLAIIGYNAGYMFGDYIGLYDWNIKVN